MVTAIASVQDRIDQVEARIRAEADADHPDLQAALEHLLSSGGKRVRPAVTLLAGGMFGADEDKLITLAAAIEMLHTATLVHDDLIDGSLLRRGNPTLNAQWSPAATVLTGDFIFARAAELAAETRSVEVMKLFARTLSIIVGGEIKQLFNSHGSATREDYFERIYAKTASMFELATASAAMLAGEAPEEVEHARRFGYEVGIAFQIVDDVLDFTGQETTVGKPVANDLRHGLVTLPTLIYLESHPGDENLAALLGGRRIKSRQINELVEAIRDSGAIDGAMQEAQQFIDRAVVLLQRFPARSERQALEDLAHYITNRHR